MARQRGLDFLVYVYDGSNFVLIGGQRNGTINLSTDIIDATNKGDGVDVTFKEHLPSFAEWGIEFSAIVTDDGSGLFDPGLDSLVDAYLNNTEINVYMRFPADIVDRYYSGVAVLGDFRIETPYDDVALASGTLRGNGAIARADMEPTP